MNITLTGAQLARLAKFAGLIVVESTDQAVLSRRVSVTESRTGILTAGYWDDDEEVAALLPLGRAYGTEQE